MQLFPGYQTSEKLHDSYRSLVYRARRVNDNKPVILKTTQEHYPSLAIQTRYRQEYHLLSQLNLAGVIKTYGLEHYQARPVIVLEDFGGQSLKRLTTQQQFSLADFLSLAIQLADILGQIHAVNIIHQDINPNNIVMNPTTGQIKTIDFGIATQLSRQNPTFLNPNILEGTLAYISPEQTGRMNRTIDYRTDFYSLGVTLYELLTGQLPFAKEDSLALIHSHIAKHPPPPHQHLADAPPEEADQLKIISRIILKLMAKNAEDRYQSAYGLKWDLQQCLALLNQRPETNESPFELGQQDFSIRFQIPQKLYGREEETQMLLQAFETVAQGGTQIMLVSGYSGVGKTALVNEVHKPITEKRGFFVTGKFDQYKRNIPYSSLLQAFRSLVRHVLTESQSQIAQWRRELLAAFGPNGQVVTEVIPEVELIIGPQEPVPTVPPTESQNRLKLLFQKFVNVFAQQDHPLTIFLDDLQWADSASLKLLEFLCTDSDTQHLFVVGAYRDNEVDTAHPLMLTLEAIQQAGTKVHYMKLLPLGLAHVAELVADTLHCDSLTVQPLAELIQRKTKGNPFFVNQFLHSLYENNLIRLTQQEISDTATMPRFGWHWDVLEIESVELTNDVVQLVANKIQRLAGTTQQLLKLAACLGNHFDLTILALVNEKSVEETSDQLWPAIEEGLIVSLAEDYKFLHDRVQQATYALMSEAERQTQHYKIGQLMLAQTTPANRQEQLFDVVNQLNLGQTLINQPEQRLELAELNLLAGRKAKSAAAYEAAWRYFGYGLALLDESHWQTHYDLTWQLHRERFESEYLNGNFEAAEQYFALTFQNCRTDITRAEIYTIKMILYRSLGRHDEVIETAKIALQLFEIELPASTRIEPTLEAERQQLMAMLTDWSIADLYYLPHMTDPQQKIITQILTNLLSSAFLRNYDLYAFIGFRMANIALKYGNDPATAYGYSICGAVMGAKYGEMQLGYQFGNLAIRVSEYFNQFQARTYLVAGVGINAWVAPIKSDIEYGRKAYEYGLASGEFYYAAWGVFTIIRGMVMSGLYLDDIYQEAAKYLDFLERTIHEMQPALVSVQQMVLALKGQTNPAGSFSNDQVEETKLLNRMQTHQMKPPLNWYYMLRAKTSYILADYPAALAAIQASEAMIAVSLSLVQTTLHYFYYALILTALYPTASPNDQVDWWSRLQEIQVKMNDWRKNCPENFDHQYLLIEAEMARLTGDTLRTMELYDQTIGSAQAHNFSHHTALAYELAAKFYLAQGFERHAQTYLLEARYGYLSWGATAKVDLLDQTYPNLLYEANLVSSPTAATATLTTSSRSTISSRESISTFDMAAVLRMSETITTEIVLSNLLQKLMQLVLESAGAQRAWLILVGEAGRLLVEGKAGANQDITVLQSQPIDDLPTTGLSKSIVNYVARLKEYVLLHDATRQGMFTADPYVIATKPKSILCTPLLKQGQLIGVLYLENNLTSGAFTANKLEILKLLSSQMAISIENARLYADLAANEKKYRTLFEDSRDMIFITTPQGNIVDVSPACFKLLGYTRSEIIEINVINFYVNPVERQRFQTELLQKGAVKDFEVQFYHRDGRIIDCLMTATARRAADGTVLQYQGIVRDVTEQKQAAKERLRLSAIERELTLAQEIQQSLLPPAHPDWLELDIVCFSTPAKEVGGDFYKYHRFENNSATASRQYAFAVGDVSGKGVSAALLMATSLSQFDASLSQPFKPADRLAYLDRVISPYTQPRRQNCAMCYVELELNCRPQTDVQPETPSPNRCIIHIINAGCIPPYIKRTNGQVEQPEIGGFALGQGLGAELGYTPYSLTLSPGDLIILTSDGVVEANNDAGRMLGFKRLAEIVDDGPTDTAQGMLQYLTQEVLAFTGEAEPHDDMTIMVVRV